MLKNKELFVIDDGDYELYQTENPDPKTKEFAYYLYDMETGERVSEWYSKENVLSMKTSEMKNSYCYRLFCSECAKLSLKYPKNKTYGYYQTSLFDDDDDYSSSYDIDYYDTPYEDSNLFYDKNTKYYNDNYRSAYYSYTPPAKKTGYLDKLNKSDTLVIHKTDPTTTMLSQIYEGKGWDVLNDTNVDKNEIHELIKNHDRIVMLGHGYSGGLMGGNIAPSEAPYLADKKLFAIWCNADQYFNKYLPNKKDFFCTKNAPSEVGESIADGCGNISAKLMLDNITYWSKLCADVVEDCLNGNIDSSVDYIRKNYLEKYGNHPVSIFNADSVHNQGYERPLPKYEFKGEKLEPKDYPVDNFDEEAFLKNPTMKASNCPVKTIEK